LLSQLAISSFLKKYKADVFVTGKTLKTKVRQCLVANHKTDSQLLKRAARIIVHSNFSKIQIAGKYKINENRMDVVYKGVDENFQLMEAEEREKVKVQYAEGNEYFLTFIDPQHNLLNLLKAFSVFKKMQKSNMQLLVALPAGISKELSETLRLYKFKSEVKLLKNTGKENLIQLTSSAYAAIFPTERTDYIRVLKVLKCNVPVIANKDEEIKEICSDAVLYVNSSDYNDIADKMMLIYKDENLRRELIEKEKEQVNKYLWDNSADLLWKSIEKACG
jgi:glycosyltransferase involved in cell wall biosynthesis